MLARAEGRSGTLDGRFDLSANTLRDMHKRFADLGSLEAHVLDTTGQSAAETVDVVRTAVSSGAVRLSAIPDLTGIT